MNEDIIHIEHCNVKPLQVRKKLFKSAYDFELTEKDLEKAARELGETAKKKEAGLLKLKEKLSNESDIKFRHDDLYLLRFLRVRKYDVSKTFHNVKFFFEKRKKHSDFFTLSPELKQVHELNWLTILPYTDEEGSIMIWQNLNRWNPHEKTVEEMVQTATAITDIMSMNPACQINGVIAIFDFCGLTTKHVSELLWNGRFVAILSLMIDGYPWRIKKVILLNSNWLLLMLFRIMKPFLQKKIRERCFFLGSDMNELHQHVDPAVLPKKLNGYLEDEECNSITEHVLNNLPYLRYERTFILT